MVVEVLGPVTFLIQLEDGKVVKRHMNQIRKRKVVEYPEGIVDSSEVVPVMDSSANIPDNVMGPATDPKNIASPSTMVQEEITVSPVAENTTDVVSHVPPVENESIVSSQG